MVTEPTGGKKKLNILHLEDDYLDAELVREVLSHEDVDCRITVAENRAEFVRALENKEVDLVISDYKLPDFRGDEALTIVREKWPDLPFIFVSGSIGEERATEAVKMGATDYVMKERLRRLGVAVHRAIEEADAVRLRREAEAKLEVEREFLNDVFASVQAGIMVLNERLEIVRANPTAERLFPHLLPLVGKPWSAFWDGVAAGPAAIGNAAQSSFQTGKAEQENRSCQTASGVVEFSIFAFPLVERRTGNRTGVILYLRDISREKQLQQQLIQSQKMESIGQLADGVAHDFNNILQAIMASGEMLAAAVPAEDPRRADVDEIRKACERAASLTRQLLAFSRKQAIIPAILDLNALAKNMGKMLSRIMPDGIKIEFDLEPALATVKCDPGNMEQVILNLVVNARDAMPKGGRIVVATRNREVSAAEAANCGPEWHAGSHVCLTVRDTGTGMLPEVMAHLFEPFFTTKVPGKGTGLGLPTVYGIAKQHGGWMEVSSAQNIGTTFTMYLPVCREEAPPEPRTQTAAPVPVVTPKAGSILVVEDDSVITRLIVRALEERKYTVHTVNSCALAREQFAAPEGKNIRLLVADVICGDGNGVTLAVRLQRQNPDLRVLLMSGYVDEQVRWEEIQARGYHFLLKPFALPKFIQQVQELLAE